MVAAAFGAGMEVRRVVLLGLLALAPLLLALVLMAVVLRQRNTDSGVSALFCEGVAAELRSGSTLAHAISASAAALDLPLEEDGRLPVPLMPRGELEADLALIVPAAARAGSKIADVFDELGSIALAEAELRREVRIASSATRVTAALFIAAPALFLVWRAQSNGIDGLLVQGEQRILSVAGLSLFGSGLAIAALLVWRSR